MTLSLPTSVIERTAALLAEQFAKDSSGHDWEHIQRVRRMAIRLARQEQADVSICELAALLHDIADWKFHGGDLSAGPRAAREWLTSLAVAEPVIDHVCAIVEGVTFKGAGVATVMATLEGRCVQDADRLDAIGAIGIGRAFAFGGAFGRAMYDPAIPPSLHQTFEDYRTKSGPTLNHFYEKLFLLKDRMQTASGRAIAEQRHAFMTEFVARFLAEIEGEDDGRPLAE